MHITVNRSLIVLMLSLFQVMSVYAQSGDVSDSLVSKQPLKEKISLKLETLNSAEWFKVNGNPGSDLRPNSSIINSIGFNYRFASLSYQFLIKQLPSNSDNDIKGETKTNGLSFVFSPGQWTSDFSWVKTKGYYLKNTDDYISSWEKGYPYLQFPDLKTKILRLRMGRILNSDYSLNAVTLQTEKQLRSAGSFLPNLRLTHYSFDDETPLTGTNSSQKSTQIEAIASIGYIHTFLLSKQIYLSIDARPGIGYLNTNLLTRLPTEEIKTRQSSFVTGFNSDVQLDYNGNKYFAGLRGSYSHFDHRQGENTAAKITNDRSTWKFYIGIRIKAPEKLKNEFDKVESKLLSLVPRKKRHN